MYVCIVGPSRPMTEGHRYKADSERERNSGLVRSAAQSVNSAWDGNFFARSLEIVQLQQQQQKQSEVDVTLCVHVSTTASSRCHCCSRYI